MKKYLNVIENYWINLKIKSKIIAGFSIVLILLFFFSLIIIWANYELSKTQKITEYSLRAINYMQIARLYEKDFFLTKDMIMIEKNAKSINEIRINLNKILKTDDRTELESKVYVILKYLDYYEENYMKVVTIMKEKGLTSNEGNIKKINDSYKFIFNSLRDDDFKTLNTLMKVDKLVTLYLDKKEAGVINDISAEMAVLDSLLKEKEYEEIIYDNLNTYRMSFYAVLSIDNQIEGTIVEFQEYIKRIENEMENYISYINELVGMIKIKSIMLLLFLTMILITLVVFVSVFTTRGITKPINKISDSTRSIKGVTLNLTKIVERNAGITYSLTNSIERIVKLIDEQSVTLNESSVYILNFTKQLKEITEIANKKRKYVERMENKINTAKDEIIELVNFVKDIEKNSQIMIETSDMITKVATQTKVLAINSGIEASNAGEFGKVLKIVAREIKELSEKTSKNASEIVNSINKNKSLIQNSSNYADNILDHFLTLVSEIGLTGKSTIEIINRVNNISSDIPVILNYIDGLMNKNEIVKFSGNDMRGMAVKINENINHLISVKSDTHNAVTDIISGINRLSDVSVKSAV